MKAISPKDSDLIKELLGCGAIRLIEPRKLGLDLDGPIDPAGLAELVDLDEEPRRATLYVNLGEPVHRNNKLRNEVAWAICDEIIRLCGGADKLPRIVGIIGTHVRLGPAVVGVSNLLCDQFHRSSPIAAVSTHPDRPPTTYGDPEAGGHYFMVDDVVMEGSTISRALNYWVMEKGYPVKHVIVFADSGQNGLAKIKETIADIADFQQSRKPIGLSVMFTLEDVKEIMRR